jgi:hypothetical protein
MRVRMPSVNMVAVTVLVASAGTTVGALFGVHDPLYGIMFVSAWMLPISRLTLRSRPLESAACVEHVSSRNLRPWFVILGALPWFIVPWAQAAFPTSILWRSLDVPVPVRWVGMALTVGMFCAPFCRQIFRAAGTDTLAENDVMPMGVYTVTAAAVVLISANLFIAFVAASGMICLFFARHSLSIQSTNNARDLTLTAKDIGPEVLETYTAAICSAGRA